MALQHTRCKELQIRQWALVITEVILNKSERNKQNEEKNGSLKIKP